MDPFDHLDGRTVMKAEHKDGRVVITFIDGAILSFKFINQARLDGAEGWNYAVTP